MIMLYNKDNSKQSNAIINYVTNINSNIEDILLENNLINKYKNMCNISIIGATNAGKSSLFNFINKEELSIVSEYEGTTRDLVKEEIELGNNMKFNLIDTAGLRSLNNNNNPSNSDIIENFGIKKALSQLKNSFINIILLSFDNLYYEDNMYKLKNTENIKIIFEKYNRKNNIIILNKIDLNNYNTINSVYIDSIAYDIDYNISALNPLKNDYNNILKIINDRIIDIIERDKLNLDAKYIITSDRQKNIITNISSILKIVIDSLEKGTTYDYIIEYLYQIKLQIEELEGNISNDDILKNIFNNFCIGK